MMRLSRCVLLTHEDKIFQGVFVASLSIPCGDTKDDSDRGEYHLDEVAVPILLAWRLQQADVLRQFNPRTLVSRASRYLILHGPVTAQERWEENSGYSPSTLATIISSVVCAAKFARGREEKRAADFLLDYADWLSAHLEEWTVTNRGELVMGKPRHYVRITPADPKQAGASPDPDEAEIVLANGGGKHPLRPIKPQERYEQIKLAGGSNDARCAPLSPMYWK
ncbi:MAG: glycoside hydrolase family 15 protein [Pirellulaceae bacterium]